VLLLPLFGVHIAYRTRRPFKRGVMVKFSRRLETGEHSRIGEGVWLDNVAETESAATAAFRNAPIFCAGIHDWSRKGFGEISRHVKVVLPTADYCQLVTSRPLKKSSGLAGEA